MFLHLEKCEVCVFFSKTGSEEESAECDLCSVELLTLHLNLDYRFSTTQQCLLHSLTDKKREVDVMDS